MRRSNNMYWYYLRHHHNIDKPGKPDNPYVKVKIAFRRHMILNNFLLAV
jgi:hypothetical protein